MFEPVGRNKAFRASARISVSSNLAHCCAGNAGLRWPLHPAYSGLHRIELPVLAGFIREIKPNGGDFVTLLPRPL